MTFGTPVGSLGGWPVDTHSVLGAVDMSIVSHENPPIYAVPRIKTRVLVSAESGATQTAVWEQWIDRHNLFALSARMGEDGASERYTVRNAAPGSTIGKETSS